MRQKIYQIDAFTNKVFSGNPAAVCPLQAWLSGEIMQKIAMENNLAETVFYVKKDDIYEIRWFTPVIEVDLYGQGYIYWVKFIGIKGKLLEKRSFVFNLRAQWN